MRFEVTFGGRQSRELLDGRLLLMISNDEGDEPRFQILDGPGTQQVFGSDVEGLHPGVAAVIDSRAPGYPRESLDAVPPGTYRVQALLHRYETFHRADGHVLRLPMDRGEGQQWHSAPGNLYSTPREVVIDPSQAGTVRIELDRIIPPIPAPVDTPYIRHETIACGRLTAFWGRPMRLGANILLPHGFDEHPEARYPVVIVHGHFAQTFEGFREAPPDPGLEPEYSERFDWPGYNRTVQEHAHQFYLDWIGPGVPRVILVQVRHPNPYYDDSYAVNSASIGPYGDAITRDLLPHIERTYRGLGEGWARFLCGGSTGGWAALAAQVFYPDEYNGCWAACPDPIDFRAFTVVDIYRDKNAYVLDSFWKRTPRPGRRSARGHVHATLEEMNRRELVLGTKGRSGQQWDAWEAVFSPVGPDGYPKRLWDRRTGAIDRSVADHWREHYDLVHIMRRDWEAGLGEKLRGKIHLYVGEMDDYYLNNAVYLADTFFRGTTNPPFEGQIEYGRRAGHCWNGDHDRPIAISRLRYHQMYLPKIVDRLLTSAPPGGDVTSWRY